MTGGNMKKPLIGASILFANNTEVELQATLFFFPLFDRSEWDHGLVRRGGGWGKLPDACWQKPLKHISRHLLLFVCHSFERWMEVNRICIRGSLLMALFCLFTPGSFECLDGLSAFESVCEGGMQVLSVCQSERKKERKATWERVCDWGGEKKHMNWPVFVHALWKDNS